MKKNVIYYLCMLLGIGLFSCTQDKELNNEATSLPDVQLFITKATINRIASTRGGESKVENVCFHDSISGETYDYNLITYSNGEYAADFNKDGIGDLKMQVDGMKIIGQMDGCSEVLNIKEELKDGYLLYSFTSSSPQSKATYTRISWWECVSRLAMTREISVISLFGGQYVAGALAIICLDSRNRWDVS